MPFCRSPRLAALFLALGGCTIHPTPSQIADCRSSALLEARPGPKAVSIFLDTSAYLPSLCLGSCYDMLRTWRLDYVEFRGAGSDRLVDRVRYRPRGDLACAPTGEDDRQPRPPLPLMLSVPRGLCLAVERGREPSAEVRLSIVQSGAGDHGVELYEAVPRGSGAPLVRVRDFTIRAVEAGPATCSDVVRGFPDNPFRYVLDRIAERR